jgi:NADH-quinone oxidoreductase subunit D
VNKVDVQIGYLHRGFEKQCENSTWVQCLPYVDRLNYVSPLINNVGYAMAVEKLCGIELTERCKYVRTIASEISRLTDHLTCVGAAAAELGALSVFFYLVQAREMLWDLVEELTGARMTTSWTRFGGVAGDLPEGFGERCTKILDKMTRLQDDADALLTRNRIFIDRMQGVGCISQDDAISYGFTGPALRSTGVAYDVRKDHPYLAYDRLRFDVPVGENGDNLDRYLVRMEEIRQSRRIVMQALAQLPDGPVNHHDPRFMLPDKQEVYESMEGLVNHFLLVINGARVPAGEAYAYVEGPNGELGFYVVSDGSGRPVKVRCRPPCFYIMSGVHKMIEGYTLADIVPTFGGINMIGGECDR